MSAPGPAAAAPPPAPTSSTTPRTKQAAGPACATATPNAASTTGSSKTPAGPPSNSPAARSGGPRHRAGNTSPNQPATPSKDRQWWRLPKGEVESGLGHEAADEADLDACTLTARRDAFLSAALT